MLTETTFKSPTLYTYGNLTVDESKFNKIRRSVYHRATIVKDIEVLVDDGKTFKYSFFDIIGLNDVEVCIVNKEK